MEGPQRTNQGVKWGQAEVALVAPHYQDSTREPHFFLRFTTQGTLSRITSMFGLENHTLDPQLFKPSKNLCYPDNILNSWRAGTHLCTPQQLVVQ